MPSQHRSQHFARFARSVMTSAVAWRDNALPPSGQRPLRPWQVCLAVPMLCVVSVAAHAQQAPTSVTLYGIIDQSIAFTDDRDGKHLVRANSGAFSGSRWGLKVHESLGNGFQALGLVEAGFDTNTGRSQQGGAMFGRQAFVGLASVRHGTLTFGRQYDASVDTLSPLTAGGSWASGINGRIYGNDNAGLSFRLNNAVKYTSPTVRGIKGVATYSFGNGIEARDNRAFSLGAQFAHGPLMLAGSYVQLDGPNSSNAGGAAVDKGSFSATKQRTWGTGITYQLGHAQIGANYSQVRVLGPTAFPGGMLVPLAGAKHLRMDNMEVHLKYPLSVALTTGLVYIHTRAWAQDAAGTVVRPHWHQLGGVADYVLSKRTDVYLAAAYQYAAGGRTGSAAFDRANLSQGGGLSSRQGQWTAHVGLRHRF